MLAAGAVDTFTASAGNAFAGLKQWAAGRQDWLFGHFAYDLAAETEPAAGEPAVGESAATSATDPIGFPDLFFFVPEVTIQLQTNNILIGCLHSDPASIWQAISQTTPAPAMPAAASGSAPAVASGSSSSATPVVFTPRIARDEYLSTIDALRRHILRGDCYEINFCQEFFAQPADIDPYAVWRSLSNASPNPFAAFYRIDQRFLLCASPERFLKKTGNDLFSQPIKGTAPRVKQDPAADRRQRDALFQSAKDRAENVMVVDLVRNDLSRICRPGSVRVSELFGIYTFPQVYQMISTVTGEMLPGLDWTDAIRSSFPMGSMTGAPKNRVVQLIRRYERSRRGLFSGAVGYVTPEGDFDFNVVIRSLLYNRGSRYLSYQVGSGITFYSDPEAEYEECLVKAEGIRKAMGDSAGNALGEK
ncbi:para-aminobenzoate synthase [Puia dinghuensis]|uniref:Para-aminobenzoate synthase n=1 Tax=Puia dinghuensis TaxID=1792502 RepID=A0A8J2XS65_9BACT|nr:para-aminobenzoate synthase [Puia dinghuensis]